MEPEGSLPHSQVPATCPYPKSALSSPYPHSPLPEDPPYYHPPICAWVSHVIHSLRFPHQNPVEASPLPIRATCPARLILLDFITRTILGEVSSSLCSFLHSPVTSSLLRRNILLNTLFSDTFSLRSSLSVSDQVSHPYKTTGKIIFLYILNLIFLDSYLEDKIFCVAW